MFFHSWAALGRVAVVSAVLFVLIVALLRIVGQKALAKMSGYDVVVTISLGSIAATVILSRDVSILEALTALVVLMVMQEATRWLQSRWLPIHHSVRERPRVVLWDGHLLEDRLLRTSTSADEVRAAVRRAGFSSLSEVRAVVLENDGEWSVVRKRSPPTDESAFFGLKIPAGTSFEIGEGHPKAAPPTRIP